MTPIKFDEVNCTYAENQPEYRPLPSHVGSDGRVTTCWSLTLRERIKVLFGAPVWWQQLTFSRPLQPQRASVEKPQL